MSERTNKVIKGNCEECQFEPENGHAHTCSNYICRCPVKEWKVKGFTEKLFGKPVKKSLL